VGPHAPPEDARSFTPYRCTAAPQDDDIPGIVRYRTYEVLKEETSNPRLR
jgi:hypothetical protein